VAAECRNPWAVISPPPRALHAARRYPCCRAFQIAEEPTNVGEEEVADLRLVVEVNSQRPVIVDEILRELAEIGIGTSGVI
jgi:hypothetical protein